jgi:integrin beta 3
MLDGKEFGEEIVGIVRGYVEREIAPLKAENESLKERIAALEARPAPEKGEKGEPGERGADGNDGADGKDGQDGKDAANIVEALKDSGELVLTLADGRLIRTGIRDGEKGADGKDGFSLDDFDIEPGDDGRTYALKFQRGDIIHKFELSFPCPVYCGVWKEGESYVPGDIVSFGGSGWHCNREDPGKPETKDCGWQLMVKRGRDGKDAKNG